MKRGIKTGLRAITSAQGAIRKAVGHTLAHLRPTAFRTSGIFFEGRQECSFAKD